MGDSLLAVSLGTSRTATAVYAGRDSVSCALLDNSTMKCWGYNATGQLAQGDAVDRGDNSNEMGDMLAIVALGSFRVPRVVAVGGGFICAALDNGHLRCWGANASGQLGQGDLAVRGDAANEVGDSLPRVKLGNDN
jgi:alpha-tubulin suppressor-like RCC1 family protein